MDHYLDIRIRPDPEFSTPQLMNALFAKLHRVLVEMKSGDIGISFPDVDEKKPVLGDVLRLHSSIFQLQILMQRAWLSGMSDHLLISKIIVVPERGCYRTVSRVQSDSNPKRLRRRLMRRHGLSEAEAKQRIPDQTAKKLTLPYVNLRSQSSGQYFRLFIHHGVAQNQAQSGTFSYYGLSSDATVPWF